MNAQTISHMHSLWDLASKSVGMLPTLKFFRLPEVVNSPHALLSRFEIFDINNIREPEANSYPVFCQVSEFEGTPIGFEE